MFRVDRGCSVEGCCGSYRSKGLCSLHYQRSLKGDVGPVGRLFVGCRRGESQAWLRELLTKSPSRECIEWPFGKTDKGYGRILWEGERKYVTHVVLEENGRPRTKEKPFALHSCDNPPCVNPDHLRWGHFKENAEDKVKRGRQRINQRPLKESK